MTERENLPVEVITIACPVCGDKEYAPYHANLEPEKTLPSLQSDAQVEDASREAVMFWMVLEHVTDPLQLLVVSRRILVPGRLLAFSIPNGGSFERHLFGKYWLVFEAPRHLQVFTSRQIQHILAELGYEQVQIIHQANLRYCWGSLAAWHWSLLIPRKLLTVLRCSGRITVVARKKHI